MTYSIDKETASETKDGGHRVKAEATHVTDDFVTAVQLTSCKQTYELRHECTLAKPCHIHRPARFRLHFINDTLDLTKRLAHMHHVASLGVIDGCTLYVVPGAILAVNTTNEAHGSLKEQYPCCISLSMLHEDDVLFVLLTEFVSNLIAVELDIVVNILTHAKQK